MQGLDYTTAEMVQEVKFEFETVIQQVRLTIG